MGRKKGEQGNGAKLTAEMQQFVCACLASGFCPELIVQKLTEEYGVTVTRENIRDNYQNGEKWKEAIKQLRELFQKEILSHPLAIKRNRLNWLLEGLNESLQWRHDKSYFFEGSEVGKVEKKFIGVIPNFIREARAEVEGEKGIEVHNPIKIYLPEKKEG